VKVNFFAKKFVHFSLEAISEHRITLSGSRTCLRCNYAPDSEKVTAITIEEGVELVDEKAFCDYKNIKTIVFPVNTKIIRQDFGYIERLA
jgi:hypothetical protein